MQAGKRALAPWAFALVIAIAAPGVAHGAIQGIVKIADQSTPIPGGVGNFTAFSEPQTSLGNVVFTAGGSANQRGVYRFDRATGTVLRIVDANSDIPKDPRFTGSALPPEPVFPLAVYGPDVTFGTVGYPYGDLVTTRGGLHRVSHPANRDILPLSISMDAQSIVYTTPWTSTTGANIHGYVSVNSDGTAREDHTTTDVHKVLARGGVVRHAGLAPSLSRYVQNYVGGSGGSLSFSNTSGGLSAPSFQLPGESGKYVFAYGDIWSDDGMTTVFGAASTTTINSERQRWGLFTLAGAGPVGLVADNFTVVPDSDGSTTFGSFSNVTIDNGIVAFIGGPQNGPAGIYAYVGGGLRTLITAGDTLDGKTVQSLSFSDDRPLSGYDLVFTATFTDGSSGLYLAEVPEPAGLSFVLIASAAMLTRRRAARAAAPRA